MPNDETIDPKFFTDLMLEVAQEQSLAGVLDKLVRHILSRPVARAYFWLVDKGDICATCMRRFECPDQTRCLHLARKGGHSIPSDEAVRGLRQPDPFARIPLGVDVPGKVAATGRQMVLADLDKEPGDLAHVPW